jgi:hypothetical protein
MLSPFGFLFFEADPSPFKASHVSLAIFILDAKSFVIVLSSLLLNVSYIVGLGSIRIDLCFVGDINLKSLLRFSSITALITSKFDKIASEASAPYEESRKNP